MFENFKKIQIEGGYFEPSSRLDLFDSNQCLSIIFFEGQIFDAYSFVCDLVREAKSKIVLFDNYVDDSVLVMLDKRKSGVSAQIYPHNISRQLHLDLIRHNAQYPLIKIDAFANTHDRFLCIDETVYHIGASLKDLGKKWFAFSKMEVKTDELLTKL